MLISNLCEYVFLRVRLGYRSIPHFHFSSKPESTEVSSAPQRRFITRGGESCLINKTTLKISSGFKRIKTIWYSLATPGRWIPLSPHSLPCSDDCCYLVGAATGGFIQDQLLWPNKQTNPTGNTYSKKTE